MGNTKQIIVEKARRADTGQYTTKGYAIEHPDTTVIEKTIIKIKNKKKNKKKTTPKPKKSR